jgi:cytoskeletal protein RodZ
MALFNRNNRTNVPAEIQEYYQTERRERAGIAWLLAFGTIVVTIVLAAGIFFAGRWAYRKIAGTDSKKDTSSQQASNQSQDEHHETTPAKTAEQLAEEKKVKEEQQRQQAAAQKAEQEREAARKATEAAKAAEQKKQKAAQEAAANGSSTNATQTAGRGAEQVAGASNAIPNTGPGSTFALFAFVSVAGYLAHRLYEKRKAFQK